MNGDVRRGLPGSGSGGGFCSFGDADVNSEAGAALLLFSD